MANTGGDNVLGMPFVMDCVHGTDAGECPRLGYGTIAAEGVK